MSDHLDSLSDLEAAADDGSAVVAPPSEPMAVARQFLRECMSGRGGLGLLLSHRGGFYGWSGTCWPELDERQLRHDLYVWLEHTTYEQGRELVAWAPTRAKVGNAVDALHAVCHLDGSVVAPAWLDGYTDWAADHVVALANGLLNVRTRELVPHTPAFFTQHALPFAFDPDAPAPARWNRFLHELWGDDEESIETLAEVAGYILGGATGQQKMFMLVGPKRSGKGTIGRILTGLLGAHNTSAPTLSGLTSNFGLAPLIGKPLAIISDARLSGRADTAVAVERLLSISGEDSLTIDRKYRDPWTGQLPTRFLILTNELPRFADSSGALASRFILLTLANSFYGRENPGLTKEILQEAPGIFNWALAGLDRLTERGYFAQPASAKEALQHFEDLASPVGAFIRDSCLVGHSHEIATDILFGEWKAWCQAEGRTHAGTKATFVKDLRAVVPTVRPVRRRRGEGRRRILEGITISDPHPPRPRVNPAHHHGALYDNAIDRLSSSSTATHPTGDIHGSASGGPGWAGDHATVESTSDRDDAEVNRLEMLGDLLGLTDRANSSSADHRSRRADG